MQLWLLRLRLRAFELMSAAFWVQQAVATGHLNTWPGTNLLHALLASWGVSVTLICRFHVESGFPGASICTKAAHSMNYHESGRVVSETETQSSSSSPCEEDVEVFAASVAELLLDMFAPGPKKNTFSIHQIVLKVGTWQ